MSRHGWPEGRSHKQPQARKACGLIFANCQLLTTNNNQLQIIILLIINHSNICKVALYGLIVLAGCILIYDYTIGLPLGIAKAKISRPIDFPLDIVIISQRSLNPVSPLALCTIKRKVGTFY